MKTNMHELLLQIKDQISNEKLQNWVNYQLIPFANKNEITLGQIEHILDYFKSKDVPNRINRISVPDALNQTYKWTKALNKKSNRVKELAEDVKEILNLGDFKLVKLISKESFAREGSLMAHCVSSYYGRNNISVYSLRDENNQPHCTIEVLEIEKKIQQIKGKGNGPIHPRYIKSVIEILKHFDILVRDSEMKNLGYVKVNKKQLKFLLAHFDNIKTMELNKNLFVYLFGHIRRIKL